MGLPESQNEKDARVQALWEKLDPSNKGFIDLDMLESGLKKIDHPLKDSHELLKDVVKAIGEDGGKVVCFKDFRKFMEHTEKGLFSLFQSIDRDHNGRLDKNELEAAFRSAGLRIPRRKLDQFFAEVDYNHDGYISFNEWRKFLLFFPIDSSTLPLKAVIGYYSSAFALNAEGDAAVRDSEHQGLGKSLSLYHLCKITVLEPWDYVSTKIKREAQANKLSADNLNSGLNSRTEETVKAHNLRNKIEAQDSSEAQDLNNVRTFPKDISQSTPSKKKSLISLLPPAGYFAAGGIAGAISRTTTAPLDRLKVYLIANIKSENTIQSIKEVEAKKIVKQIGRPLIEAMKELWRAGGMRSLFAGNGLNVVKVMPESAIKFGSYEAAKRALARLEGHDDPTAIKPVSQFVAGGMGGIVSQFFVYPLDTLKFRMQCETVKGGLHGNALIAATARKMYQRGLIQSSYRGLFMGIAGMFPYAAIDLGTFEMLKKTYIIRRAKLTGCKEEDVYPGAFVTGCIGAFSGAFGASLVYPINVLRTRLQAQGTVLHPPTYTGIWDVTQKTIRHEGIKGLFKGITPNLLKVVPSVSITYIVYESSKKLMNLK